MAAKTWRDELQPASFRGVPFWVDDDSAPAGRRTQLHEYPQRNKPKVEDLGEKTRIIQWAGFVIGDDCFFQRDNLLHALNQPGEGILVHPWFGQMTVTATDCNVSHRRRDGGMVMFDLTFIEAGDKGYPAGVPNTARQLEDENESLLDSIVGKYKAAMALVNKAKMSITQLQNGIAGVQMAIQREISQITGLVSSVVALADMVMNFPDNLSSMLRAQFSSMTGEFDRFSSSKREASSQVESAQAIAALPPPSGGAATVAAVQATRDLVREILIVYAVRVVSAMPIVLPPAALPGVPTVAQQTALPIERPEVPTADEVLALRDALVAVLWEAALVAPFEHFERLQSVRKLVKEHLTAVAQASVRMVAVTPKQSLPALVLAYQQFGDATRAAEIVTRNKITHPGFLPPLPLQVAQE
ncbi:prophage DNA circulation protein [Pseudomonas sp. SJZ080]|uniref:DNA circularization protein n=1 Tax=Pseudomonas sp. SJZ080 TaxID=2572888 RepID=UPI00119BE6BB|nr:DNA circularization N-terminal domain-containing protein [Pseudomonas sp. SJZ080]TWC57610.1 prophage DNA circulation protein [Pseudomonas sp. SJZ080]